MRADVLTVTYGDCESVVPLLRSLESQLDSIERIHICHNGPAPFDAAILVLFAHLPIVLADNEANLGYGGGINRLWPQTTAPVVVVVNPDVELEAGCMDALIAAALGPSAPVLVAGLLLELNGKVNAFALSLTWDGVGINVARGGSANSLRTDALLAAVGPSGALFAVSRTAWEHTCGGPVFVESLFLYLEDLALGMKVRRQGGGIIFCAEARAVHRFSDSPGKRSALKLYYVERNRLWLQRALGGRWLALGTFPFTLLRYWSYAVSMLLRSDARAAGPGVATLASALARAWATGVLAELPSELAPYLGPNEAQISVRQYLAPLREQLRDPTA